MFTLENVKDKLFLDPTLVSLAHVYRKINSNERKHVFKKFKSTKYWIVLNPIQFKSSWGETFIIPKGFETDLSTVPKWLWGLLPPFGDFLLAAIIHDYLYVTKPCSKEAADKEMLIWSKVLNSDNFINRIDNYLRYYGVKYLGFKVWKRGIKNQFNP